MRIEQSVLIFFCPSRGDLKSPREGQKTQCEMHDWYSFVYSYWFTVLVATPF